MIEVVHKAFSPMDHKSAEKRQNYAVLNPAVFVECIYFEPTLFLRECVSTLCEQPLHEALRLLWGRLDKRSANTHLLRQGPNLCIFHGTRGARSSKKGTDRVKKKAKYFFKNHYGEEAVFLFLLFFLNGKISHECEIDYIFYAFRRSALYRTHVRRRERIDEICTLF